MAAYVFLDSQNDKVSALPSSTTAITKDDKQWHIPAKLYFIFYISFEMVCRGPFGIYDSEFWSQHTIQHVRLMAAILAKAGNSLAITRYADKIPQSIFSKLPTRICMQMSIT